MMSMENALIRLAQSSIGWNHGKDNQQPDHPDDLSRIIPLIAEAGYDGIELHPSHLDGKTDTELRAIKGLLDQHGLAVPLISPYFNFTKNAERAEESMAKARLALHQARILGAEGIRTFTGGDRSADADSEQWQRCVDCLQELADVSQSDGIHWCLHTHDWNLVDNAPSCLRLLDLVARKNVTLLYKPAYFAPAEHWNLELLGHAVPVVQVTASSPDDRPADLGITPIDYRATMHWFAARQQPVWMSFTWMGLDALGMGQAAIGSLQTWRSEVVQHLA
jgi:hypothetical protein